MEKRISLGKKKEGKEESFTDSGILAANSTVSGKALERKRIDLDRKGGKFQWCWQSTGVARQSLMVTEEEKRGKRLGDGSRGGEGGFYKKFFLGWISSTEWRNYPTVR